MAEYYETLRQWNEPERVGGKRHEVGEIAEIDPVKVPDLPDLVQIGTVRLAPKKDEASAPPAQAATGVQAVRTVSAK